MELVISIDMSMLIYLGGTKTAKAVNIRPRK